MTFILRMKTWPKHLHIEILLTKAEYIITQLYAQISCLCWSADIQLGNIFNCKAYVFIFRQLAFRDFLRQEVVPQLRLAIFIQVKGSHKHGKNATKGKQGLLFKKKKIINYFSHDTQKLCQILGAQLQSHIDSSLSPFRDQLSHWLTTCGLVWMLRQKHYLFVLTSHPISLTVITIKGENSEKFILVMSKSTKLTAIFRQLLPEHTIIPEF